MNSMSFKSHEQVEFIMATFDLCVCWTGTCEDFHMCPLRLPSRGWQCQLVAGKTKWTVCCLIWIAFMADISFPSLPSHQIFLPLSISLLIDPPASPVAIFSRVLSFITPSDRFHLSSHISNFPLAFSPCFLFFELLVTEKIFLSTYEQLWC